MRKPIVLLVSLALMFAGCSGDDLHDSMTEDLTTEYTFYDYSPSTEQTSSQKSVKVAYRIGTVLTKDSLPTEETDGFALKKGYMIDGWKFYQSDGAGQETPPVNVETDEESDVITRIIVTPSPRLELFVSHWSPISYTIVFDGNGGIFTDGNSHVERGGVYDVPLDISGITINPRSGYDFKGWNTEANRDSAKPDYTETDTLLNLTDKNGAVVTLYACWCKQTIEVSFDPGEGRGSMESVTLQVGASLPPNKFAPPEGKYFTGWILQKNDGASIHYDDQGKITENNYPNADVTLVAQWEWMPITVSFAPNGGDGTMDSQEFLWGQAQPLSKNQFTRYGYDFAGWKADGMTYTDGQSAAFKQDTTLVAQWKAQTVTITFSPNGGTGRMENQVVSFEALPQSLMKNAFTRLGWNFVQWRSATGATFSDGYSITSSNWDYVRENAGSLSAQWTPRGVVTSSSPSLTWNATSGGLVFTAPSGSNYRWKLGTNDDTLSTDRSYTIKYADYSNTTEHILYVTMFVDGIPQTYYAKFHVDPQR